MERVVYCPSQATLGDADVIATEMGLPVQIGDSQLTGSLKFDRNKVQVVSIPNEQSLSVNKTLCRLGQLLQVEYVDEFDGVSDVFMVLTYAHKPPQTFKPDVTVKGVAALFNHRVTAIGKLEGEIVDKAGVLAEFSCEVRP